MKCMAQKSLLGLLPFCHNVVPLPQSSVRAVLSSDEDTHILSPWPTVGFPAKPNHQRRSSTGSYGWVSKRGMERRARLMAARGSPVEGSGGGEDGALPLSADTWQWPSISPSASGGSVVMRMAVITLTYFSLWLPFRSKSTVHCLWICSPSP